MPRCRDGLSGCKGLLHSYKMCLLFHVLQEVSLASCVFEGDGLSACVAGSTASFRLRACDARGYTVASATADFTLTVVVDGKEIPGAQCCCSSLELNTLAQAMGCWQQYTLVGKSALKQIVEHQAIEYPDAVQVVS